MSLISIDLKSVGLDPQKIADIQTRADNISRNLEWLSVAAVAMLTQLGQRFHFDLPPPTEP